MESWEKKPSGVELSTLCRQLMIEAVTERIEQYGNDENSRIQGQRNTKNNS
jgi:hypothetical protein